MRVARRVLIAFVVLLCVATAILWKQEPKGEAEPVPSPTPESTRSTTLESHTPADEGSTPSRAEIPAETAPPEKAPGSLVVTLTDGKAPVRGGTVHLTDPKGGPPREQAIAEEAGSATFGELTPGNYRVLLDHLPEGWLPPRILTRDGPRDFIETSVRSGPNSLELVLERPVRVFGKVFGADGEPVDGITIRFATLEGEWTRRCGSFDFQVHAGSYEGGVYEGLWAATLRDRYEHAGEPQTIPVPEVRRLAPGSATEIDFTFERASGALAGRVLDEHGEPFAGVTVFGIRLVPVTEPASGQGFQLSQWIGRDKTGEDGTFSIAALAPGPYRLLVDSEGYRPVAAPGQNKVGAEVAPVEVEVDAAGTARTDITVPRSHLVRVHGSVVVDESWASGAGASGKVPAIHLIVGPIQDGARNSRHSIDGGDGRFDFLVEAASTEPRIELSLGMQRTTIPLALSADKELPPLVLHFPR